MKYTIILASNSPRRKELLAGLGIDFIIKIKEVNEEYPEFMPANEVPLYLSQKKADAFEDDLSDTDLIITADTIVSINGTVLGKPHNREHAIQTLQLLSNKEHEVVTGVTLKTKHFTRSFATTTKVRFNALSLEQITYYIDNYKPYDKAGAYGIQEWIGYIAIASIEGSFYNVMGLPVQRLYEELSKITDIHSYIHPLNHSNK